MNLIAFIILILFLTGGFWGYGRGYGPISFGPVGLLLLILLIMLLTGVR